MQPFLCQHFIWNCQNRWREEKKSIFTPERKSNRNLNQWSYLGQILRGAQKEVKDLDDELNRAREHVEKISKEVIHAKREARRDLSLTLVRGRLVGCPSFRKFHARLYRDRCLQLRAYLAAFFGIYKIDTLLHCFEFNMCGSSLSLAELLKHLPTFVHSPSNICYFSSKFWWKFQHSTFLELREIPDNCRT